MTYAPSTAGRRASGAAAVGGAGAYGFRLAGLGAESPLLGPADPGWPTLELAVGAGSPRGGEGHAGERARDGALVRFTGDGAEIDLGSSGRIVVSRSPLKATFAMPGPLVEHELLHPHLGGVAAVAARWLDRDAVHAGAFVVGDGVWALLGGRGTGKSSLLAWLALQGLPVVGDDVLVLEHGCALPAPRFVDLRADAAAELGVGEALGRVGERERWRMSLPAEAPLLPLRGWILLGWGDAVTLDLVPASRRLLDLVPQLTVGAPPPEPGSLLDLAALPMLEFRRPRDWRSSADAGAFLLDGLDHRGV